MKEPKKEKTGWKQSDVRRSQTGFLAAGLLLMSGVAGASPEALERELREQLGQDGAEVTFTRVFEDEARSAYIAEGVEARRDDGETVTIERYRVIGDYQAPSAIEADDLTFTGSAEGERVHLDALRVERPGRAVISAQALAEEGYTLGAIEARGLRIGAGNTLSPTLELGLPTADIAIDSLRLDDLREGYLGRLDLEGLRAEIPFDSRRATTATFTVQALVLEAIEWSDAQSVTGLARASLDHLRLEGDEWHLGLERLWLEGSPLNGASGLEGGYADLVGLFAHLPPADRESLKLVYEALTGGEASLRFASEHQARLSDEDPTRLEAQGSLTIEGAGRLSYDADLLLTLPGTTTRDMVLDEPSLIETSRVKGGRAALVYHDEGLLPRALEAIATVLVLSPEQTLDMLRQEAETLRYHVYPGAEKIPFALLAIMQGKGERLSLAALLPKNLLLDQLLRGPLYWEEPFDLTVELD